MTRGTTIPLGRTVYLVFLNSYIKIQVWITAQTTLITARVVTTFPFHSILRFSQVEFHTVSTERFSTFSLSLSVLLKIEVLVNLDIIKKKLISNRSIKNTHFHSRSLY